MRTCDGDTGVDHEEIVYDDNIKRKCPMCELIESYLGQTKEKDQRLKQMMEACVSREDALERLRSVLTPEQLAIFDSAEELR